MLAARGVSLGLGGRINLSELNHLPRDKMMLGKLNKLKREQKAEQRAQQARLIVRKHVDSKTLWTACVNVIVGSAIIAIGLVMTVLGYFDSNDLILPTEQPPSPASASNSQSQPNASSMGWLRFALRSMQYVGPVFCGIGMFLMIIACVITLESRDRHAQVIQEESTELRRSRRQTSNNNKMSEIGGGEIRENGLTVGRRNTHSAGDRPRRKKDNDCSQQEGLPMIRDGLAPPPPPPNYKVRSPVVHLDCSLSPKFNSTTNTPTVALLYELSTSDASSTDAMNEYTFPNAEEPLRERRTGEIVGTGALEELISGNTDDRHEDGAASGEQQQQPSSRREVSLRRKSTSAIQQSVNRRTPRGTAPLVRVESVVEFPSISAGGSPTSTTVEPKINNA